PGTLAEREGSPPRAGRDTRRRAGVGRTPRRPGRGPPPRLAIPAPCGRDTQTWGIQMMKFPRRRFLHLATGAAAVPAVARIAWAQTYPSRPVRIIVPFPAGQATDSI